MKLLIPFAATLSAVVAEVLFNCGPNFEAGCCSQFFTNPFDEYASGIGCSIAGPVIVSDPVPTQIGWRCDSTLTAGCCEQITGTTPPIPWLCQLKTASSTTSTSKTSSTSISKTTSTSSSKITSSSSKTTLKTSTKTISKTSSKTSATPTSVCR